MLYIISGVLAYMLGSISPSILIGKAMGVDIKKAGSGNAGTTNALRVLGKKSALITLVVDVLKGVLAVILGGLIAGRQGEYLCLVCVIVGHIAPLWYNFKGGKGVAVAFGAITAVNPIIGLISLCIVVITFIITRMVSLSSILAAICIPFLTYFFEPGMDKYVLFPVVLVIYMHKANIKRIMADKEDKISFSKRKE